LRPEPAKTILKGTRKVEIECNCGQKVEIPDDFVGDFVICPRCKVAVKVDIFPGPKEKLRSSLEYAAEAGPSHCPVCGKAISGREKICPHCGGAIPEKLRAQVERPEQRPLPVTRAEIGFFQLLADVVRRPLVTMEALGDYFSYVRTIIKLVVFYFLSLAIVALYAWSVSDKPGLLYYDVIVRIAGNLFAVLAVSVAVQLFSVYYNSGRTFLQTFLMVVFISSIMNILFVLPLLVNAALWLYGIDPTRRISLVLYSLYLLLPINIMLFTLVLARMYRHNLLLSFLIGTFVVLIGKAVGFVLMLAFEAVSAGALRMETLEELLGLIVNDV